MKPTPIKKEIVDGLIAKLGIQAQFHPTWVQVVGNVEIHVCLGHDVGVWRAQLEGRNLYVIKGRHTIPMWGSSSLARYCASRVRAAVALSFAQK